MSNTSGFKRGDYIEVTPVKSDLDTGRDFGIIRGTALEDRGLTGLATFSMALNIAGRVKVIALNLNFVEVRTLFRADVARGEVKALDGGEL
jgi:hypothetical protein